MSRTYLTTAELAERIKYDTRTIRERLKDSDTLEGKHIALDMARFGVRSNAIAPFARTRLVGTIPDTPENHRRLEAAQTMTPDEIAPFVVALCSDGAKDVTGQVFGVRRNEIVLFSQPRPIRTVHASEGWTPESCLERAIPALKATMVPMERSSDVFNWDPV